MASHLATVAACPASVRLYGTISSNGPGSVSITNGDEVLCTAGSVVTNVHFKVYNSNGDEIQLPTDIGTVTTSYTWGVDRTPQELPMVGTTKLCTSQTKAALHCSQETSAARTPLAYVLPDIKAPRTVGAEPVGHYFSLSLQMPLSKASERCRPNSRSPKDEVAEGMPDTNRKEFSQVKPNTEQTTTTLCLSFAFRVALSGTQTLKLSLTGDGSSNVEIGSEMVNSILVTVPKDNQGHPDFTSFLSASNKDFTVACYVPDIYGNTLQTDKLLVSPSKETPGCFVVTGVKFRNVVATTLGWKTVYVRFKTYVGAIRLNLVAGKPVSMMWNIDMPWVNKHLPIINKTSLNVGVQLVDAAGNAAPSPGILLSFGTDAKLQGQPYTRSVITDGAGRASFGSYTICVNAGLRADRCPLGKCLTKCYGVCYLGAKGRRRSSDAEIHAPKVQLHVLCNASDPVKFTIACEDVINELFEVVRDDLVAGGKMPFFHVGLLTEADTVVKTLDPSELFLQLRCVTAFGRPSTTIYPKKEEVEPGIHLFEIPSGAPIAAGTYNMVFQYRKDNPMTSKVLTLLVKPDVADHLAPVHFHSNDDQETVDTIHVLSSSDGALPRTDITFELKDKFGNTSCSGRPDADIQGDPRFNGMLVATVVALDKQQGADVSLLTFKGGRDKLLFPIVSGSVKVGTNSLALETLSTYVAEIKYAVRLTPCIPAGTLPGKCLDGYDLRFIVDEGNSLKTKALVADMSHKRKLANELQKLQVEINDMDTALGFAKIEKDLKVFHEQEMHKSWLQYRYISLGVESSSTTATIETVDQILEHMSIQEFERKKLEDADIVREGRTCKLEKAPNEPDILGKIGHLALLDRLEDAFVLSWHMQGDMDVIVTYTSAKAKELNRRLAEKQQLLSLDSTFTKNLPRDWNGSLPHTKTGTPAFRPSGNPVYVRNLLHFPRDLDGCRVIFGSLLGDTLLLDTLEDAIAYRRHVIKVFNCPTILTRDGHRVRNNGKYGGASNRVPGSGVNGLRFGAFGLTPHPGILKLDKELAILKELHAVMSKREAMEKSLANLILNQKEKRDQLHVEMGKKRLKIAEY